MAARGEHCSEAEAIILYDQPLRRRERSSLAVCHTLVFRLTIEPLA